ncbi:MAG: NAD-dependent epimerase/dehydratase family protein [Acidobacteria bacterium]|nr:NAD-dependent epimerase/dehydratase family protein [Acidobacteriota bacterium]
MANFVTRALSPKILPLRLGAEERSVAVIGGAGYIGSILCRRLLAAGHSVRVLDRLSFGGAAIEEIRQNPRFTLFEGDFRDIDLLLKAVRGADAVVHLAALVGDAACALHEKDTVAINYHGVELAARVCKGLGVPRFVFASTCSVYGSADQVVSETSALNPVSLYATTKIDAENMLLSRRGSDFHPTVLRIGTAFGWSYRPRFDLVVNLLTAKAHFENQAVIYNGEQWRPFVHIVDISRAFQAVLDAPLRAVSGEIFNVGDDRMNHRLNDVGEALRRIRPSVQVVEEQRPDARNYRVCFDKISRRLAFQSRVTLVDGMREIEQNLVAGKVSAYQQPVYHNHRVAELALTAAG